MLGGLKIAQAVGTVQNARPTKWWGSFKIYVFAKSKYKHIEGEMGLVCSKNGVEGKFILIGEM